MGRPAACGSWPEPWRTAPGLWQEGFCLQHQAGVHSRHSSTSHYSRGMSQSSAPLLPPLLPPLPLLGRSARSHSSRKPGPPAPLPRPPLPRPAPGPFLPPPLNLPRPRPAAPPRPLPLPRPPLLLLPSYHRWLGASLSLWSAPSSGCRRGGCASPLWALRWLLDRGASPASRLWGM